MTRLLDASQAGAGDEAAVAAGDTWAALMARAAGHLARGVVRAAGRQAGLRVVLVVGKGNNGGDGWAAAHRLHELGCGVTVASVVPTDVEMSAEATDHRDRWLASGGRTVVGLDAVRAAVDDPDVDVLVDCLLGTGISGAPRGEVGEACAAINDARDEHGTLVVACDVPSGVSSDDGTAPGDAVRADATVTMGGMKRGLVLHPGAVHAGRVMVGDLGPRYAPPATDDAGRTWTAMDAAAGAPSLLDAAADKRARGTVLLVGGSVGAAGAAILMTRGALWSGAGLTTLATPAHVQRVIAPVVPSAMTLPLRHAQEHVSADAVDQLDMAAEVDAVAAGPGLGPTDGTRAVVDHLRATADRLVLDADAINVYRDDPEALREHHGALVLTPARTRARPHRRWRGRPRRLGPPGRTRPRARRHLRRRDRRQGPRHHRRRPVRPLPRGARRRRRARHRRHRRRPRRHDRRGRRPDPRRRPARPRRRRGPRRAAARLHRGVADRGAPRRHHVAAELPRTGERNLRSNGLGTATTVGFGPSSALPEALPDAARVLSELARHAPSWPL